MYNNGTIMGSNSGDAPSQGVRKIPYKDSIEFFIGLNLNT